MKRLALLVIVLSALLAGCYSRVVAVNIMNQSATHIRNVEVIYAGGSYGIARLDGGKSHQYRIKPLAAGEMRVRYLDAAGKQQDHKGPRITLNDQGTIDIFINDVGFKWTANVISK